MKKKKNTKCIVWLKGYPNRYMTDNVIFSNKTSFNSESIENKPWILAHLNRIEIRLNRWIEKHPGDLTNIEFTRNYWFILWKMESNQSKETKWNVPKKTMHRIEVMLDNGTSIDESWMILLSLEQYPHFFNFHVRCWKTMEQPYHLMRTVCPKIKICLIQDRLLKY